MKFRYCFYGLLILICAFIPFRPSSTDIELIWYPCVEWGAWTVGQSSGYGNSLKVGQSSGNGNSVDDSFITNSEQTCCVYVEVKYCEAQYGHWVYPITSFKFDITMNNGFEVKKYVYGTSGPDAALLSSDTSFSVKAKLEGPPDVPNAEAPDPLPCSLNGRSNIPMKVTVKFTGYYGTDPNAQLERTLEKTWEQDDKDMCRQEYVDYTPTIRKSTGKLKAELPLPSKSSFVPTISTDNGFDKWNTGHYKKGFREDKEVVDENGNTITVPYLGFMIDDGLKDKKKKWLAEVNTTYRIPKGLSAFTDTDFKVTSGYRNPYHQRFHIGAKAFHSRHCYGDALDIHTLDVDGDGLGPNGVEQKRLIIPKGATDAQKAALRADAKRNSDDGVAMERAADDAEAEWTGSWEYYSTHTHADWTSRSNWYPPDETVYYTPCDVDGTASEGPCVTCVPSSSNNEEEVDDTDDTQHANEDQTTSPDPEPSTPTTVTYTCGIHSGDSSSESSDHQTTISGYSGTFYECQPHQTFGCGHIDLNSNASSHSLQASCTSTNTNGDSCTVTNFYLCQSHTHQYPAPTITCNGCSATVNYKWVHWQRCSRCNKAYYTCKPNGLRWHTHQKTCLRTKNGVPCGQSFYSCSNPNTCFYGWTHSGSAHHVD